MKTIGLIGGMSWESTAIYYRLINEGVRERLGGLHSARLLMWSFDFAEIAERQHADDWAGATEMMVDAARRLEAGGAEALVICTNTMHKMADDVQAKVAIPIIHIADATAAAMKAGGVSHPLLLATRFTMEQDFYKGRLADRHGITPVVPDAAGRDEIHRIIYEELVRGVVTAPSKDIYLAEVARARASNPRNRRPHHGLHRDHHANRPGRFRRAGVRYDGDTCACGGGVRAVRIGNSCPIPSDVGSELVRQVVMFDACRFDEHACFVGKFERLARTSPMAALIAAMLSQICTMQRPRSLLSGRGLPA